ncbi:hypothetical protein EJB05_57385, partial [Eragrostis curvula]
MKKKLQQQPWRILFSILNFCNASSENLGLPKRDMENIVDNVLKLQDSELYVSEEIEIQMIHDLISAIPRKKWHPEISDMFGTSAAKASGFAKGGAPR